MPNDMKELSLHILDIAMNSVKANAAHIEIHINEDLDSNMLRISVLDDGIGMSREKIKDVCERKIPDYAKRCGGLGIPLFKQAAENAGGALEINSVSGKGTAVKANFEYNSPNRAPVGSIEDTIIALIIAAPHTEILYKHRICGREFVFNTVDVLSKFGSEENAVNPKVLMWIRSYIKSGVCKAREFNKSDFN